MTAKNVRTAAIASMLTGFGILGAARLAGLEFGLTLIVGIILAIVGMLAYDAAAERLTAR